jgi:hypothetical protein
LDKEKGYPQEETHNFFHQVNIEVKGHQQNSLDQVQNRFEERV